MKAIHVFLLLLLALAARAQDPFAQAAALLPQQHAPHTSGVKPLTLAELETAALEANPEIKVLEKRLETVQARIAAAGSLEDASLMYRAWGVPFREPWNFNQAQNMLMVTQPFPGPGKRALRSQIAGQDADVAKAEIEAKKRDVIANVRLAFYALLRNYDELRLHDEQVALARQALQAARIKYTVGRVPQQDVLKAQIALSKLVDHVVMLRQDGELARARLNTLVGRDPGRPIEVAGEYRIPGELPELATLQEVALQNRPELQAVSAAIRQSETRLKLARKAYTPDFAVSGGYMVMPSGSPFRNTYMAEFSMTLPWLNRRRHDSAIASATSESSAVSAEYDARRAAVFHEIRETLIRTDAARRLVELYRDTLRPQAQTTLKATTAAYQTDRTDFLNLLDSQNLSLDVEYAYYRALSEYEQRLADLERAIGAPLPRPPMRAKDSASNGVRP